MSRKAALIILDGWGHSPDPGVSAITKARTPFMDSLYAQYPNAELVTHGLQVGLPDGQMGNSEVGHLNLGAGRVVYQELARINKAIEDDELRKNPVLQQAIARAKEYGGKFHLLGLFSPGGVHSHVNHLIALCQILADKGIQSIYVHAFTDGRDVDPTTSLGYMEDFLEKTRGLPVKVASIIGRYYAMDRDNRWERIKLAYDLLVQGTGKKFHHPVDAIQASYDEGLTDEFLKPLSIIDDDGNPLATIDEGDSVLFYNFRTDRPRQLTKALTQENFPEQAMHKLKLDFMTMCEYDERFEHISVLFENDKLQNTLGEFVSAQGLSQLRIAETEKYPHVTFFFSGGREKAFEGEERILIPSPKVATYDLKPSMSALEVTNAAIDYIREKAPDFICLNFANPDMVGHTGVFEAAVEAVETVDSCLQRLVAEMLEKNYHIIIIADHGNADTMKNADGSPHTSHTKNPVPVIYLSNAPEGRSIRDGKLADIAPTLLHLMGLEVPEVMTGENLVA